MHANQYPAADVAQPHHPGKLNPRQTWDSFEANVVDTSLACRAANRLAVCFSRSVHFLPEICSDFMLFSRAGR
jgi:hypothetical protein